MILYLESLFIELIRIKHLLFHSFSNFFLHLPIQEKKLLSGQIEETGICKAKTVLSAHLCRQNYSASSDRQWVTFQMQNN